MEDRRPVLRSPPPPPGPRAPRHVAPGSPSTERRHVARPAEAEQTPGDGHRQAPRDENVLHTVDAVSNCRLPPFWRAKSTLWFLQVEAVFRRHRVRGDDAKYDAVVGMLDSESLQDVEDVVRAPPNANKYERLKETLIARLTDSADRQLLRLFTQLELGDQKPSQLLRQMRTLAGERVPDEVLRVKWLDLLPTSVQRLLRILKASGLEELAAAADELMESRPEVAAASHARSPSAGRASAHARAASPRPPCSQLTSAEDRMAAELAPVRRDLAQLIALNREILDELRHGSGPRDWSRDRAQRRAQSPAPRSTNGVCHFHQRWGNQARRCLKPCAFQEGQSSGN